MNTGASAMMERVLVGTGVLLLGYCAAALTDGAISSRTALREFDQVRAAPRMDLPPAPAASRREEMVDFGLWTDARVRAYRAGSGTGKSLPLAVLAIEKTHTRVPVFDGTDSRNLNRGAGWIAGTARPGQAGNIGIAGHRDGVFRQLKDVAPGDVLELSTLTETALYTVQQIEIVAPENLSVLKQRARPALTLVTCYPFYFVGSAPQRYIVHASLKGREAHDNFPGGSPQREPEDSKARR